MKWLDGITDLMDMSLHKVLEIVQDGNLARCSPWHHRLRHNLATGQQYVDLCGSNPFCSRVSSKRAEFVLYDFHTFGLGGIHVLVWARK